MDALVIVALVVGGVGLIGGSVGVWVAMRTATRIAVRIVAAATEARADQNSTRE